MSKNASAVSSLEQFANTAGPSGSVDVAGGAELAALLVSDDVDEFDRSDASGGAAAHRGAAGSSPVSSGLSDSHSGGPSLGSSGGRGLEERFEGSLRIDRRSRTRSYEMEEEAACGRRNRDEGGRAHWLPSVPVTPATSSLPNVLGTPLGIMPAATVPGIHRPPMMLPGTAPPVDAELLAQRGQMLPPGSVSGGVHASIAEGAARPPAPGSTLPSKSQRTAKLLAALARAQHLDNLL